MPAKGYRMKSAKKRSVQQRKYNGTPRQLKRRAKRNADLKKARKAGRIMKGSTKELDHKSRRSLSYGSTQVISRHANRKKNGRLWSKRRKKSRS